MTLFAAGPLGRHVSADPDTGHAHVRNGKANGQLVLRRVAWVTGDGATPEPTQAKHAYEALWRWSAVRIADRPLLTAAHRRRQAAVGRLEEGGHHVERLEAKPVWRAVVGLGDEVPQETGLRLHGTYGWPILPGQSLKGLAASEGDDDPDLPRVMGSPRPGDGVSTGAQGEVIFLDALPTASHVSIDVMTPHVTEHYEHQAPPGEYWQPNPVSFLVLTEETSFRIHLAGRGDTGEVSAFYAAQWLAQGLSTRGIGAKTSAGYGYMTLVEGNQ